MRILLTGGTGFLGKRLARALVDAGHELTCFVRPTSDRRGLEHPRIAFATGDVTDASSVRAAFGVPVDAVIHAAALVSSLAPRERFAAVNVIGFRTVARAAVDAGVDRLLYVSSFFALGPTDGTLGDEATCHDPHVFCHPYEWSKYEADRHARKLMADGAPVLAVYPGVLYGPGELTEGNIIAALFIDFLTAQPWLARKMPGVLGDGSVRWSYAFIDDVVQGCVAALERGAAGERYVLGGENVPLLGLQRTMADLSGLKPFTMQLPFAVAWLAGLGEEIAARLWGRPAFNTRATARIFTHDWAYDSSKAARELGYAARPLRDGLRETYDWIQRAGLVRRPRRR